VRATFNNIKNFGKPILGNGPFSDPGFMRKNIPISGFDFSLHDLNCCNDCNFEGSKAQRIILRLLDLQLYSEDHLTSYIHTINSLNIWNFYEIIMIFINIISMKSDFSRLGWKMDEYCLSLMDLSLKEIIHSKQHELLKAVRIESGLSCKFAAYLGFIIPDTWYAKFNKLKLANFK